MILASCCHIINESSFCRSSYCWLDAFSGFKHMTVSLLHVDFSPPHCDLSGGGRGGLGLLCVRFFHPSNCDLSGGGGGGLGLVCVRFLWCSKGA